MGFDAQSAELVAPEAPAAEATGKFQPDSAQPVATDPKQADDNFKAQWEQAQSPIDKLGVIGNYFKHPFARYEQSVEQSFSRPKVLKEIPAVKTTEETPAIGQAAAPVANAVTGTINAMQTPGGASMALNPAALVYATPYFAAKTWESAKKSFGDFSDAIGGKPTTTGQLAEDVVNTAMGALATTAGVVHGGGKTIDLAKDLTTKEGAPVTPPAVAPAAFDPATAQPVEAAAATPKPAPAEFAGVQEGLPATATRPAIPDMELYNLTEDIPGHPKGSTVSRQTLEEAGYEVPAQPMEEPINANQEQGTATEVRGNAEPTPSGGQVAEGEPRQPEAPAGAGATEETQAPVKPQTNFDFNAPENQAASEEPTYGIAARVSEERSGAGHIVSPEPGEGISTEESIVHGRDLLESGRDPQQALDEYNKSGRISADDIALVRAHGETLAKSAYDALDKFGKDSPEYQAAAKADSDWLQAVKPMQTEWHKIGQAQQGETEVDTGNFHALRRAFNEATGKDFTEKQASDAQDIADKVKQTASDADTAKQNVLDAIKGTADEAKPKAATQRISDALDKSAADALERIKARHAEGRVQSGLDPEDLADHVIYGAAKIAKGAVDFAKWSAEMAKDLGDYVKPHLQEIWDAAKAKVNEAKPLDTSVQGIWQRAKDYLNSGETDYDEIRHKIATDLGIPVDEVSKKLTEPKSMRTVTDEMYAKMANQRRMVTNAKDWLKNQQTPGWLRFAKAVPRIFFIDKVLGHGTVGMITHAGLNIFHPEAWKTYWPAFMQQFKLLGMHDSGAYHEQMMQDLVRDPLYTKARRFGLANDPQRYTDDYQNTWIGTKLDKLGLSGNRGFDALKIFRQARFSQIWNALPKEMQTPDMGKMIADSVNHATGVVRMPFKEWTNWTFFAPKLEGSRWAWMLGDPMKAAKTITNWAEASDADKQFAIREFKQKATIAGTYLSLLAANQGLLSALGSTQSVNFTNPRKSDFLAFKGGGMKLGIVSPMLGVVRLFANLLHAATGQRKGLEALTPRAEEIGQIGEGYLRGKLSPFAGFGADIFTQADFQGRPMPWSNDKVPSYFAKQGLKKYSYGEYAALQFSPIPVSEALHEIWTKQGIDESTQAHYIKALLAGVVAGTTGARLSRDESKPVAQTTSQPSPQPAPVQSP